MDGTEIESYSREDYQKENYIGQISHIYISNSEYTGNSNLHSDGIDHITLSNAALKSIFSSFFASWFHAPTQFIIEDSTFHALQSILQNKMTTKNAQMILDLMYQNYMLHSKANFCGKRVEYIQVKITDISSLIPEEAQTIGYQSEYAELSLSLIHI